MHTSSSNSEYTIEVMDDFSRIPSSLRAKWDELCAHHAASFFQSVFWTSLWWKHFATSPTTTLVLIAAYDERRNLCAIFPGMITKKKIVIRTKRVLTFIGQPLNDCNDIWYAPGHRQAAHAIVDYIQSHEKIAWDIIDFDEVSETSTLHESVRAHYPSAFVYSFSVRRPLLEKVRIESNNADLPSLSKNDLNNRYNKLKRATSPKFNIRHMRDEVTEHLPHAVLLNTVRAREAGFSSFFTNHAMEDFIKDLLMEESGNQFWACLSSLSAREEPIAYAITLHAPKGRVYYFNTFNPAYAQYTPATLLMRELLKNFYTSQENVFDFGRGEWPYKLRFATSAAVNMNLFVAPHNPAIIKFYQWWYGIKQVLKRSPMIYTRITKIQKGKLMRKLAWFSN